MDSSARGWGNEVEVEGSSLLEQRAENMQRAVAVLSRKSSGSGPGWDCMLPGAHKTLLVLWDGWSGVDLCALDTSQADGRLTSSSDYVGRRIWMEGVADPVYMPSRTCAPALLSGQSGLSNSSWCSHGLGDTGCCHQPCYCHSCYCYWQLLWSLIFLISTEAWGIVKSS